MAEVKDQDYLDPTKVNIIYIPRENFYIPNMSSGNMTNIAYTFYYDEANEKISLKGHVEHPGRDSFDVETGDISLKKMDELLRECCEKTIHLTTVEPIKTYVKTLQDLIHETLGCPSIVIKDTHDIELGNTDGSIVSRNKPILSFGSANIKIVCKAPKEDGKKGGSTATITGEFAYCLPLVDLQSAQEQVLNGKEVRALGLNIDGQEIELTGMKAIEITPGCAPFVSIKFKANTIDIRAKIAPFEHVPIPNELMEANTGCKRISSILIDEALASYTQRQMKRHGIVQKEHNQAKREKIASRFLNILE